MSLLSRRRKPTGPHEPTPEERLADMSDELLRIASELKGMAKVSAASAKIEEEHRHDSA